MTALKLLQQGHPRLRGGGSARDDVTLGAVLAERAQQPVLPRGLRLQPLPGGGDLRTKLIAPPLDRLDPPARLLHLRPQRLLLTRQPLNALGQLLLQAGHRPGLAAEILRLLHALLLHGLHPPKARLHVPAPTLKLLKLLAAAGDPFGKLLLALAELLTLLDQARELLGKLRQPRVLPLIRLLKLLQPLARRAQLLLTDGVLALGLLRLALGLA